MDERSERKMNHLSDTAIRLLGSTQVITSVYSVVKELLENSLDAGATSVEIKLTNFGLDRIEVRDNGCGIQAADIPVLAKRHFTSKITSHSDLESLASYGFRGEALASLCAVSEVLVTTKTPADDVSYTYNISSEGDVTSSTPSYLGQGTTVCAANLFKNLPVRKQYHSMVKKRKEDLKNVENLLLAYAVIKPKVRFSLHHDKRMVWQKIPLDNTAAVLQSILGKGVIGQMEWKKNTEEEHQMQLELCVPKPGSDVSTMSRSTSDRSFLCINGRPVSVKEIDKLVRQYYCNCHACETSRYPIYYLGVSLQTKDVDVNIDPNKTTVFAANMDVVLEKLEEMLLYIYGPLDEAPSWRYRDSSDGKGKPSASGADDGKSLRLHDRLKSSAAEGKKREDCAEVPICVDKGDTRQSVLTPSASDITENVNQQRLFTSPSSSANSDSCSGTSEAQSLGESVMSGAKTDGNAMNGFQLSQHRSNANNETSGSCHQSTSKELCTVNNHEKTLHPTGDTNNSSRDDSGEERMEKEAKEQRAGKESITKDVNICSEDRAGLRSLQDDQACGDSLMPGVSVQPDKDKAASESLQNGPSTSTVGWTHGTSVRSADGTAIQPVCLLAPSPAHRPGKRPLSPSSDQQVQKEMAPSRKRERKLCPAQVNLYDLVNNVAMKRPLSAKEIFFKEKRPSVVASNPQADYEEVTGMLSAMWDQLSDTDCLPFREKCWQDTHRYNKEVAAQQKPVSKPKVSTSSTAKQVSVRDMVAAASTQPPRKARQEDSIRREASIPFSLTQLRDSLDPRASSSIQLFFEEACVLGRLQLCSGAWVVGKGSELCILNAHRLSEALVYQQLLKQHCLSVHHCQPVTLTSANTGGHWTVLETLASSSTSLDTFIHLADSRITHNGFDVKCWKDGNGSLCAELVGVCGDVPTYGAADLVEVLEAISRDASSSLAQCRPLKVSNYLKGEAVRMVRKQTADRSASEVQGMLEEGATILSVKGDTCLHGRPVFHTLLQDLESVRAQAVEAPLDDMEDSVEMGVSEKV